MSAPAESVALVRAAAHAAVEKLATDVVAMDVSELLYITDAFVVCSADSERQVGAVVDGVEEELLRDHSRKPLRREGQSDARWVLLDYGDIVVHVLHAEDRAFYALERLWKDAPRIDLRLEDGSSAQDGAGQA